jgi:hypothetical protein
MPVILFLRYRKVKPFCLAIIRKTAPTRRSMLPSSIQTQENRYELQNENSGDVYFCGVNRRFVFVIASGIGNRRLSKGEGK